MSQPQAAIVDRPVAAPRSAPARAESPSAERYAPFVRIAALRAVLFRPRWPETSWASNYGGVIAVNSLFDDACRDDGRRGVLNGPSTAFALLLPAGWPSPRGAGARGARRSRCRPSAPRTAGGRGASTAPRRAPRPGARPLPSDER